MEASEIANKNIPRGWTENIKRIVWGVRTTPNPESKKSPFEMYFGRKPKTSFRLLTQRPSTDNSNLYPTDLDCRRILKPGHLLNLTDADSTPDMWQDEDGSQFSDTVRGPETEDGDAEIEEMTEEDEVSKSPKKRARVQKKGKATKKSETHYFAKIPSKD